VQVQTLIKHAIIVELKLLTGDLLIGKIGLQDQNCLCIINENNQPTTVWRARDRLSKTKQLTMA
jgi:host factor-I protein